jgi:hypothetical protein
VLLLRPAAVPCLLRTGMAFMGYLNALFMHALEWICSSSNLFFSFLLPATEAFQCLSALCCLARWCVMRDIAENALAN